MTTNCQINNKACTGHATVQLEIRKGKQAFDKQGQSYAKMSKTQTTYTFCTGHAIKKLEKGNYWNETSVEELEDGVLDRFYQKGGVNRSGLRI